MGISRRSLSLFLCLATFLFNFRNIDVDNVFLFRSALCNPTSLIQSSSLPCVTQRSLCCAFQALRHDPSRSHRRRSFWCACHGVLSHATSRGQLCARRSGDRHAFAAHEEDRAGLLVAKGSTDVDPQEGVVYLGESQGGRGRRGSDAKDGSLRTASGIWHQEKGARDCKRSRNAGFQSPQQDKDDQSS
eukprot:3581411-Pleurochrysis_carterae.AAC.1